MIFGMTAGKPAGVPKGIQVHRYEIIPLAILHAEL